MWIASIIVQSNFFNGQLTCISAQLDLNHVSYCLTRANMKLRTSLKRTLSALAVTASCATAGPALAADAAPTGDAAAAASKLSLCIGCHGIPGYKASFPEIYHVPMIAGQNAEYLASALREYASGARTFPSMEAIARTLSEQDIANLAAYYSNLK
jgi:cytochrome c553